MNLREKDDFIFGMAKRIMRLEAALKPFVDAWPGFQAFDVDTPDVICGRHTTSHGYVEIRRSDLKNAYDSFYATEEY